MAEGPAQPGWQMTRFDEMAMLVNDRVDDPKNADVDRYVGLQHLDPESLTIRRWGSPIDVTATKLQFRKGDIIFGRRRAYQRKLAIADFEGICSAHAMVLRAKPAVVLAEFLPFFMQSELFMERAQRISVGSLSPTINWKTLAKQRFALPPLRTQSKIAAVLTRIELACEAVRSTTEAMRSLRMAHLDRFFASRVQSAIPLRKAADIVAGSTPPKSKRDLWGGKWQWASGKDLKTRYLEKTEATLTERGWRRATIVPKGSTLVVVRGMILAHSFPVARCARATAINQDLRALIPRAQFHGDYLFLWTEWAARWFLRRVSISSHGTKRIEGKILGRAPVPLATDEEQNTLVVQGEAMADAERLLQARYVELQTLRRSLLSAALDE